MHESTKKNILHKEKKMNKAEPYDAQHNKTDQLWSFDWII